MRKFASVLLLLALSLNTSCVIKRASTARKAKTALIGMSKAELLSCAGTPDSSASADGKEFFTYESGGDRDKAVVMNRSGNFAVVKSKQRSCRVSITLKDDKVERVLYSGRTGGLLSKGEQCAFILENCVNGQ